MLNSRNIFFIGFLALSLAACGGDATDSTDTTGENGDVVDGGNNGGANGESTGDGSSNPADDASAMGEIPFSCPNTAVTQGLNDAWQAGTESRQFYANLPSVGSDTPVSVIFAWHGVGDTAQNFQNFLSPSPDEDADFPYIMIFPQGMRLQPVAFGGGSSNVGIEWDLFESVEGDDNLEAALFESILGCLAQDYTIDPTRIYHMGFSGGAILTAMMHTRYPEMVGAAYVMSGAWFNDPTTVENIDTGFLTINFRWDDLDPVHQGTILMTHGGVNDVYQDPQFAMGGVANDGRIISFEDSASFAHSHLPNHNRNVIDCAHNGGHANHPGLSRQAIIEFFKIHRAGKASPYLLDGLPAGLDSICRINP